MFLKFLLVILGLLPLFAFETTPELLTSTTENSATPSDDSSTTPAPPYHYHVPTGNGSYGVDISHYNLITNWTALIYNEKYPIKFIFTKATEGSDYVDPVLEEHWGNMTSFEGLICGVYHFYRSDDTVEENLKNIKKNIFDKIEFNPSVNLLAIDFESNYSKRSKTEMAKDLKIFLIKFEKLYSFKPFIYCGANFYNTNIGEEGELFDFDEYPLWVAHYGPVEPNIGMAWKNYTIWQFTSIMNFPGVVGHVDTDWWPELIL